MLRIINEDTRQPIVGASVMIKGLNRGGISDSAGFLGLAGIAAGSYAFQVTCTGYVSREIKAIVPARRSDTLLVTLEPDVEMLGDVVVSSSRINGRIKDLPTRVEVLGTEDRRTDSLIRDYSFVTTGVFVQDDWTLCRRWVLETGIRNDYRNRYVNFLLPRVSALYKLSSEWSLRAGGGLGYKSPTIFDAQTEETAYKDVLPIGGTVRAERSAGGNADVSYTGTLGEDLRVMADQAFFYTQVARPLVLDSLPPNGTGTVFAYFTYAGQAYTTRGLRRACGCVRIIGLCSQAIRMWMRGRGWRPCRILRWRPGVRWCLT